MADHVATALPAGVGYGVVIGVGAFFTLLMCGLTVIQNRYTSYSTKNSEEFNTASRSVKPGMIAAGIVSAWTWAATLLQSSTVAYTYGVAGPFWYAAGATVQILIFSILACKTKMNAPRCHTFLEIILYRYGKLAHCVFLFFSLVTNILVGSQLLLGGSAVLTALTGMNVYAAIFLIPLGVVLYVITGGLRATFLCDYSHTIVVMIIILYFMFQIYAQGDLIGSPGRMYELLERAAEQRPVAGNKDGSYLTLKSNSALIFGVIQLCSGSGTVFLDQAYWQRAIASQPSTAVRAYILGGLAWFAIPFGFATTMGLAAVALTDSPSFPTYPEVPTRSQISSGLASAFSASAVLGTGGAAALLITLFMAVTSCASAELIAVSSVLTFDVYKTYIKPSATPKSLIFVSHVNVAVFGLTMSIFAVIWQAIGIDLGWLFLFMGLAIGGAVFPVAFSITWRKQTRIAAISGALCGLAAGLTAWLVTAQTYYGELTLETTNAEYSTLAGNLAAISVGGIVSTIVTLIKPDDFDWEITRAINAETATDPAAAANGTIDSVAPVTSTAHLPPDTTAADLTLSSKSEKPSPLSSTTTAATTKPSNSPPPSSHDPEPAHPLTTTTTDDSPHSLRRALRTAIIASITIPFIMDFLVPIPMFLSHYIFSPAFFTAWVVISFLWVFGSTAVTCVLPVWETRGFLREVVGRMVRGERADLGLVVVGGGEKGTGRRGS